MTLSLISPAYAAAPGLGSPMVAQLIQFMPIVLVGVIFYFLLFRPQQQRQRQLKADLAALRRGDRIVTAGGIIGVVQKSRDDASEIEVEIASGVRVMVLRSTITTILSSASKPANDAAPVKK
ncbi:preprotein translocase subunit YajC [Tanticharoenia sakaeratensis]|nr:preprotein translocase subunit YajC [Tanticharoenia sakaeratensis]